MSKKLFLAVLPLLALAMASCSRGNGGASSQSGGSSSAAGDSSEESQESAESSEESEESAETPDSGQDEPIAEGYSVKVGAKYYELVEGTPEYPNQTLYASVLVAAEDGDEVEFYKDGGSALSFWSDGASVQNNTTPASPWSTVLTSVQIATGGDVTIILKQYDDQTTEYCMWITTPGGGSGEGGEGGDVPEGETVFTWTADWVWNDDAVVLAWVWGGAHGDGEFVETTKIDAASLSVNLGDGTGCCFARFPAGTSATGAAWKDKYNQSQDADMSTHTVNW